MDLESFKNDLASQRASGIIDRKTEASLYDSARLSYYSGLYSRGAVDAKTGKKLPEYLRGMQKNLSKDLTPLDTITVSNNVLNYMGAVHNAEAQDNQLIVSDLNRSLVEKTLTPAMLAQAESQLPEAEMNNFMTKLWTAKNAQTKEQASVEDLANNFTNLLSMSQASNKEKKGAFDAMVFKKMQEDPSQDPLQVKSAIANSAGGEFPSFTKQLDAMVQSGTPEQIYQAGRAIASISNNSPQNIASLSPETRAISSIFEDLREAGTDSNTAAMAAREQVLNKSKDQQEANQLQWNQFQKDNLSTPQQVQKLAKKMLSKPYGADIPNLPQVSNSIMKAWQANYKLTNGNVAAADKLTEDGLKRSYGETRVNGSRQVVYAPLEKTIGIGGDGIGLIHNDMVRNINPQLEASKQAFDKGSTDFYYRISTKETNYLGLAQDKLALEQSLHSKEFKKLSNTEGQKQVEHYRDVVKTLNSIDKSGGVEVEKVWRGKKDIPALSEKGLVEKGNIDLFNRPKVANGNGMESTVLSMGVNIDGKEILIPRVSDEGKILSKDAAIDLYKSTGKHLGIFNSVESSNAYAKQLHKQQAALLNNDGMVEKLKLLTTASKNMQITNDGANPVSGSWDLGLIDKNGYPQPFALVSNTQTHVLGYRPDINRVRHEYASIHNAGISNQESINSRIEDFITSKMPKSSIPSAPNL